MTAYRSTDTCVSCGKAIDVKTAAYTADGMVCTHCEAGALLREADREATTNTGLGALAWGMLSLVCNPFFIPSILAITGGVRELQTIALVDPERRGGRQAQGIIAIILGAFWPVVFVGVVGLGVVGMVAGAFTHSRYDDDPYYYDDYANDPYYAPAYDDSTYDPMDDPAYEPLEGGFVGDPEAFPTLDELENLPPEDPPPTGW